LTHFSLTPFAGSSKLSHRYSGHPKKLNFGVLCNPQRIASKQGLDGRNKSGHAMSNSCPAQSRHRQRAGSSVPPELLA
jgi:hypothetical protein